MNLKVENVYTRHAAKEMTRKYFWKLLGMSAVAYGIPYGLMMLVPTVMMPIASLHNLYDLVMIALLIAVSLLSCGLTLGLMHGMIELCRGKEDVTVGTVFHRMNLTFKGLGLGLWVGLKSLLWMLPGYAVMIAGIILTASMSNTASPEDAAAISALAMFAGMILIFALGIPAAMRYLLSTYILADKPNTGVFACVRQSKTMMKGHKWQAFKLVIPVFLIMYVVMMVFSVAMVAATNLLAGTAAAATILSVVMVVVTMAISVYYMIRMSMCYSIFYLKREAEQNPAEEAAEFVAAE